MAGPPTDKVFHIDVHARAVSPSLLHVAKGETVWWVVNDGDAVIVFEPGIMPVDFRTGPVFDYDTPAEAGAGQTGGVFPHSICVWIQSGIPGDPRKEQHSLQACLIVDG